ncbi:beta-fructofuranosidase, insoluble isoenzyme CWINV5-like [Olea europaea var. sylvestris]|uniref:beta-fructofuranosidase, insoluble isoenzyme CWINV5-like n=1 Tax=Olea europaea var. sylvestris TaxID=158386 RepID=UPI000C1D4C69|nr:beta-fructofuranosidase, insoluble isoenzyme CWINV5-like [Olea europaea var. sylvestris]
MWECLDYPVSTHRRTGLHSSFNGRKTKHVIKASFSDHDYYVIGNYDLKTDRYNVDVDFMDSIKQLRYDYGMFYASKTFYIEKGWSGVQSIPRTVLLDKKGKQLVQWPIRELKKLWSREVSLHNKEIKGGTVLEISGVTASQSGPVVFASFSYNCCNFILNFCSVKGVHVIAPNFSDLRVPSSLGRKKEGKLLSDFNRLS